MQMFLDKLNQSLAQEKSFISDRLIRLGFGVSAIINIIHWALLYSKIRPSNQLILLHYNVVYGPDSINRSVYIYLIPALALVMLAVNFFLAGKNFQREKLNSYFYAAATVAVQMIFLAASIALVIANG